MSGKWDPLTDMPNLEGKVVVVTGGNAGIGLSTVKYLALRGAKVYFTARSKAKADETRTVLTAENSAINAGNLHWLPMDLADLKSVASAVEELKSKETRVDILINNAGLASGTTETMGPGWEWHMGVNHVGHFVFTNGVLPLLKEATKQSGADVRIITLSSNVNYAMLPSNYGFTFDSASFLTKPVPYYPWQWRYIISRIFVVDMIRYAVSKVANLLFAQELQRLLDEQGLPILSISVHPGGVATPGSKDIGNSLFSLVRSAAFLTVDQGAITSVFAATAAEVRENADKYKVAKDEKQVKGMWEHTTVEANKYLSTLGLAALQECARWIMYGAAFVTGGFCLASVFAVIFQCKPITAAWDSSTGSATCYPFIDFLHASAALNIAIDMLLCTVPLPYIWNMKMTTGRKVLLTILFAISGLSCAAAILKLVNLEPLSDSDLTYDWVSWVLCSIAECTIGIVCMSIPPIIPLFTKCSRNKPPTPRKERSKSLRYTLFAEKPTFGRAVAPRVIRPMATPWKDQPLERTVNPDFKPDFHWLRLEQQEYGRCWNRTPQSTKVDQVLGIAL
ncbi:daunorubicin C-13 ketoreductase [Colletotrichum scovillei]|uniref:Daunorubicin C-13 ketoreductase n=1 Tax=Colletotrichum scovillei TaxID=1209932 RepID=A0A9P7RCV8_9PEZI|nr:daunorubicin C-13 ketoreductase [Colletotrichum scovillei]